MNCTEAMQNFTASLGSHGFEGTNLHAYVRQMAAVSPRTGVLLELMLHLAALQGHTAAAITYGGATKGVRLHAQDGTPLWTWLIYNPDTGEDRVVKYAEDNVPEEFLVHAVLMNLPE